MTCSMADPATTRSSPDRATTMLLATMGSTPSRSSSRPGRSRSTWIHRIEPPAQGTDYVYGENVIGSAYADTITGGTEGYGTNTHHANILWGQAGNDTLFGGPLGNDRLFGQAGNDTLDGGTDTDLCDGGSGTDAAVNCETLVSIP